MNRRHLTTLALAILVNIALWGCHTITSYPEQPSMNQPVNRNVETIEVTVRWHDTVDAVDNACGDARVRNEVVYGCARIYFDRGIKCTINAIPPKDFNDVPLLAVLGHELVHCFMGTHA